MSENKRRNLPRKSNELSLPSKKVSFSSSDDEMGFHHYFQSQLEQDILEESSESEKNARVLWESLDVNSKRYYMLKNSKQVLQKPKLRQSSNSQSSKKAKKQSTVIHHDAQLESSQVRTDKDVQRLEMEIQRLIASPAQYCNQPACYFCEEFRVFERTIKCSGICKRYFHPNCDKSNKSIDSGTIQSCPDCLVKSYRCVWCRKLDDLDKLLQCEIPDCGRLYHRACFDLMDYPELMICNNKFQVCPAHYCVSCVREDPSKAKPCSKVVECIRCPYSFHNTEYCMVAGAIELSYSQVICPRHNINKLVKNTTFKTRNTTWCFVCYKSGVQVNCRTCPASFHLDCIERKFRPTDNNANHYYCAKCRHHHSPRYGEIGFCKISQYRWWPCEIIHPRNAPINILKLKRPEGTFPVCFLGSNEYQWLAKTSYIDYNTSQNSNIFKEPAGKSKMDEAFKLGMKQAERRHRAFVNIVLKFVPLTTLTASKMPKDELDNLMNFEEESHTTMKFRLIRANVIVPPAQLPLPMNQPRCECTKVCEPPKCSNYKRQIECDETCICAPDNCKNRFFSLQGKKSLGVFKTQNCGFGLKTMECIKKCEFVIEYLGELITYNEAKSRIENLAKTKDFYLVRIASDLVIDGGPKGNLSRYINHSCEPNCSLEKWTVNGLPRIGIFALRDIDANEELAYDYRSSGVLQRDATFCLCNSASCNGFLECSKPLHSSPHKNVGSTHVKELVVSSMEIEATEFEDDDEVPPSDEKEEDGKVDITNDKKELELLIVPISISEKPISEVANLKMKPTSEDLSAVVSVENDTSGKSNEPIKSDFVHENVCFRCFDGGDLILCEKNWCPKTYHIACLGLQQPPRGTWYCPWHFCDVCGHPSAVFCTDCTSSFCALHREGRMSRDVGSHLSRCRPHAMGMIMDRRQSS